MDSSSFLKDRRKVVSLPTGGEVVVRRLTEMDYASVVGDFPSIFSGGEVKKSATEIESEIQSDPAKFWRDNRKMISLILCRGVCEPRFVDKPPALCGPNEVSIDDVTVEEFNVILNAVNSLKRVTQEDASNLRPFHAEPTADRGNSSDGEAVRETPDRTA